MHFRKWPHRTYCETVEDSRRILKHLSIWNIIKSRDILNVLLEEIQVYGNRMEAGLSYEGDIQELHKERKKLIKEVEGLEKEIEISKKVLNKPEKEDIDAY